MGLRFCRRDCRNPVFLNRKLNFGFGDDGMSPACYPLTIVDIHYPSDGLSRTTTKLNSVLTTQRNYDCINSKQLWLQIDQD